MVAIVPMAGRAAGLLRRRKWLSLALTVPALVVLTSWWLTAPLEDEGAAPVLSSASAPTGVPVDDPASVESPDLAGGTRRGDRGEDDPARRARGRRPADRRGGGLHGDVQEAGADRRPAPAGADDGHEGPPAAVRRLLEVPGAEGRQGGALRRGAPQEQGPRPQRRLDPPARPSPGSRARQPHGTGRQPPPDHRGGPVEPGPQARRVPQARPGRPRRPSPSSTGRPVRTAGPCSGRSTCTSTRIRAVRSRGSRSSTTPRRTSPCRSAATTGRRLARPASRWSSATPTRASSSTRP